MAPKRVCQIIKLKPERYDEYVKASASFAASAARCWSPSDHAVSRLELTESDGGPSQLHANAWPGVLKALTKAHFTNYSIFHDPIHHLLIAYFERVGTDWDADMEGVGEDEETRRWWQVTDECQESLVEGAKGSGKGAWWLDLKEVFRFEGEKWYRLSPSLTHFNTSYPLRTGFYFPPYSSKSPSNPFAVNNISSLIASFRSLQIPIIHIHQHSTSLTSPFNPSTNPQGAIVQSPVAPLPTEKVIIKSQNSAFIDTSLQAYLREELKVEKLIVVGLTLEYCIDSTCRHAGNLGYKVWLPRETTSAYGVERAPGGSKEGGLIDAEVVQEVMFGALHGEFVEVVSVAEVLEAVGAPAS